MKKADSKPQRNAKAKAPEEKKSSWLDYFRFGESYTSLILGIIVVIVTTILLVFLVRDRNLTQMNGGQVSSTSTTQAPTGDKSIARNNATPSAELEMTITVTPSKTPTPTVKPTAKPTTKPTIVPTKAVATSTKAPTVTKASATKAPTATKAPAVTKVPTATKAPTATPTKAVAKVSPTKAPAAQAGAKTHTVVAGENLWTIAEKYYKSGYNWVDIASANNLSNPGEIAVGTKLTIPSVAPKTATVTVNQQEAQVYGPKITGSSYTVKSGDHLWGIAVRAYNDGYRWVEIAKLNNISTPNVIPVGMKLKLPPVKAREK